MRVYLSTQFDTFTGYGNDAVDIAIGLERIGLDVVPWPTRILPGLPRELTRLFEKNPGGRYDVALAFAPPFDIHPDDLVRLAPKVVGYSMWENSRITTQDLLDHGFGDFPEGYEPKETDMVTPASTWERDYEGRWWSWSKHHQADHRGLDLMLVTCPMNVDAFRAADPDVPLSVLPCGIDAAKWFEVDRPVDRRMRFGMIGMLAGRKDPMVMIQAWNELKDEHPEFDAVLELKTSCPGLHPSMQDVYPDLVIHDRAWTPEQVRDWYGTIDVLVSTSRGEGNNKPAMEFMATGGPVIAGRWGGHENWLYPDSGYPIEGVLRTVHAHRRDVLDFRIDKEQLKATMLHCWENRPEVRQKGQRAARLIRSSLTWDHVCAKLADELSKVVYG